MNTDLQLSNSQTMGNNIGKHLLRELSLYLAYCIAFSQI